jgi:ribonuclease R
MSTASRLLRYLEKNAGKTLTRKDVLSEFAVKKPRMSIKRMRQSRFFRKSPDEVAVELLLTELNLLGMLEFDGSRVLPRKPFVGVGKASVSPSGAVFVALRGADPIARDVFIAAHQSGNALPGDQIVVRLIDKSRDRFEGSVTEVRSRAREHYRMKLLSGPVHRGIPGVLLDHHTRVTVCLPVPRIAQDTVARMKPDTVLIVGLTGKTIQHMGITMPEAEFERFESDSDLDQDFGRILMKYNYSVVYPDIKDLPPYKGEASEVESGLVRDWKERKDLRELHTVTIDGPDARDFDDAISLEKNGKHWKLYVHIADVSHYVTKGSDLDMEASRRATSVYLGNRVIPMLPPVLSENLCSLVAKVNRLAFTAEMDVNPSTGEITAFQLYKSVIRVDERLTYETAETRLDSPGFLGDLWKLAQIQKAARNKKGRIDLDMREPKIIFDADGNVKDILQRDRLRSSMLIEECMLSANICSAAYMRKREANTLYRVHDPMDIQKIEALNHFFKIFGVNMQLKDSEAQSMNKALAAVHELTLKGSSKQKGSKSTLEGVPPDRVFQMLLLRSFMQAKYSPNPAGHYGLGFEDYCHFTSPIRRYPDLVVHRVVAGLLKKKKEAYEPDEVEELGFHTSEMERKAMEAERDLWKLKILRAIERSGQKQFKGFITGFRPDRVFLELLDFQVEAIVPFSFLTNDTELTLPDSFSAYIKKLSRPAFLGEVWNLELDRLEMEEMKLYTRPVW